MKVEPFRAWALAPSTQLDAYDISDMIQVPKERDENKVGQFYS
jgi:hypothetical protein